mgnify:CR=1 FL=1
MAARSGVIILIVRVSSIAGPNGPQQCRPISSVNERANGSPDEGRSDSARCLRVGLDRSKLLAKGI